MKTINEDNSRLKGEMDRVSRESNRLRLEVHQVREEQAKVDLVGLMDTISSTQREAMELAAALKAIKEQLHNEQVTKIDLKKETEHQADHIKELNTMKYRLEKQLELTLKDLELAQNQAVKLGEQNKDLQKSLFQSNEKVYAADRRVAAMEFEANATKEKANLDVEVMEAKVPYC